MAARRKLDERHADGSLVIHQSQLQQFSVKDETYD
jgi:hypothetical protein